MHIRSLLLATASVLALATHAFAAEPVAPKKAAKSPHSFSGRITATVGANSNVGAAPTSAGRGIEFDDEDEDDGFDGFGDDDDFLEDLIDDQDIDDEELADEDDEDEDGDGTPDFLDEGGPGPDADNRLQTRLGLAHKYKASKTFTWATSLLAGHNVQENREDLNRHNWAVNTGPVFTIPSIKLAINPSITYAGLAKDHKNQNRSVIASLAAKWKATKALALAARYNREYRDNIRPRATDIESDTLRLAATYVATPKDKLIAAYVPKFETNDRGIKNKNRYGYELGYARKLPWKLLASTGFRYTLTDFTESTPSREDQEFQYNATLGRTFEGGMFVNGGVIYKTRDSNLNTKDNDDTSAFLQTGWKF